MTCHHSHQRAADARACAPRHWQVILHRPPHPGCSWTGCGNSAHPTAACPGPAGLWVSAQPLAAWHLAVLKCGFLSGFDLSIPKLDPKTVRLIPAGVFRFEGCTEETLLIGSALDGWRHRNLDCTRKSQRTGIRRRHLGASPRPRRPVKKISPI